VAVVAVTPFGATFVSGQPEEELRPWEDVRRALKRRQRRSASWPARLAMVGVLIIAVVTGMWLGPRVIVDLSGLSTLPAELGFVHSDLPHPAAGYMTSLADNERRASECESTACVTWP
jgi:hypothetical protein